MRHFNFQNLFGVSFCCLNVCCSPNVYNTAYTCISAMCLPFPAVKLFGCSAAAQVKTSRETKGQFLSVNMAFSVGVMSAMYLTKGITGK